MAEESASSALTGGVELLERAIGYALGNLTLVTPDAMANPTPCREWDLRALLGHMDDSLAALQEAADVGHVAVPAGPEAAAGTDALSGPGPVTGTDAGVLAATEGDPNGGAAPGPGRTGADPVGVRRAVPCGGTAATLAASPSVPDPVATLRDRACRMLSAWAPPDIPGLVSVGGCPITASILASVGAVEVAVHAWDVAEACGSHRPIPAALAEDLLPLTPLFVVPADRPVRFAPPLAVPPTAPASDRLLAFLGRAASEH